MTDYGAEVPAPQMRRTVDGSAASARPEAGGADGSACWDELDAERRRKAADELTALTEDLGLYDDGREP